MFKLAFFIRGTVHPIAILVANAIPSKDHFIELTGYDKSNGLYTIDRIDWEIDKSSIMNGESLSSNPTVNIHVVKYS